MTMPKMFLALMAALLAIATVPTAGTTSASAAEDSSATQLLVIMDVSGSMKRKDRSGTTLIEGARKAIEQLMDEVPGDAQVGLRLYGSKYAGKAKAQGCVDTELAVPIAEASTTADQITRAINSARPTGFTPIGKALTEAADDFDSDVERSIVLVSDGEDTCGNPEPCVAARQLAAQGIKVRVDTVGLFLQGNAKAKRQLECIAKATGGTYVGAEDAKALADELTTVSARAIQRQDLDGEAVEGGPALISATEIELGTTYVDDIVNGEAKWYSYEVEAGQTLRLTSTDDGTTPYGCCIYYSLRNTKGDAVAKDHGYSGDSANTYILETPEYAVADEPGIYYFKAELDDKTSKEEYAEMPFQFVIEATDASPTESASPTPDDAESDSSASNEPESTAPAADEDGDSDALLWTLIGLLAVAVVGLGAAVVVLLRRTAAAK